MFKKKQTKQNQGSPIDNKTVYTWIAVKKCDLFGTGPGRLFPSRLGYLPVVASSTS